MQGGQGEWASTIVITIIVRNRLFKEFWHQIWLQKHKISLMETNFLSTRTHKGQIFVYIPTSISYRDNCMGQFSMGHTRTIF